jgi:hypothetical protein
MGRRILRLLVAFSSVSLTFLAVYVVAWQLLHLVSW